MPHKQNLLCMANVIKLYAPYYNDIRQPLGYFWKKHIFLKAAILDFFLKKPPTENFKNVEKLFHWGP